MALLSTCCSHASAATRAAHTPPGGTIPALEPPGGVTLEVGSFTLPLGGITLEAPLEGFTPALGTLEPGATILETSPVFGVTINKLEGDVILEALSGVMLGGSTELGASRLI